MDFSKPRVNRASRKLNMYVTAKEAIVVRTLVNSRKLAIDKCFGDDGFGNSLPLY
jgi:hypothetical protein